MMRRELRFTTACRICKTPLHVATTANWQDGWTDEDTHDLAALCYALCPLHGDDISWEVPQEIQQEMLAVIRGWAPRIEFARRLTAGRGQQLPQP
jgi:hypothetical protein